MNPQTLKGIANDAVIGPGAVIGGRFEVMDLATTLGSIPIYLAKDQKTQRPVALWMIPRGALDDRGVEATRAAIRGAAAVAHRDLVAAYGSAVLPSGVLAIATEVLPPESLAERIRGRRAQAATFSLDEAWPTVTRLCHALSAAHASLAHGAVSPALIRIDQGVVRLAGTGLVAPLVALGAVEMEFIAPEVRRGETPTVRSDVYSVGAVLYALLSGAMPSAEVALSSRVEGVSATLDVILESCLADDPEERFEDAETLRVALEALVAPAARIPRDEADAIPVEFDLGAERLPELPGDIPVVFDLDHDPLSQAPDAPDAQSTAELAAIIESATANDSDRWIFSHGGLDHGPLTARELIAAILRHELVEDDVVVNMETDERRPLQAWPQYLEFVEAARHTRTGAARSAATRVALADAVAARRGKMLIVGASLAVLVAVGAVYVVTLVAGSRATRSAADIDSLIARGELRVQTSSARLLPPPPPSARRPRGGGGGGGGHGGGSFEAAMNAPIEFNMGAGGTSSGTGTLRDDEINRPLNGALPRFARCLGDGSARQVRLRIAIGGNGRAAGVSVDNGSGALRSCVAGVARSLQWRAFGGPRIGLSWSFGF